MSDIIQKIAQAALEVGGKLSADKTNKEQNYTYISADKILSVCGQALANQGVMVIPSLGEHDTTLYEYTNNYGKPARRYDCRVNFIFTISDGEKSMQQAWIGMGSDYAVPDKALYKAVTSGHKYFLMKLLCVGAGNEDSEHEDDKPAQGNGKPAPKAEPEPEKKPAPALDWHSAILRKLADTYTEGNIAHIRGTLKFCDLAMPGNLETLLPWMDIYKSNREAGKTPPEAAAIANENMFE